MKVLISPSSFGECGNTPLELLKQNKIEYVLNPYGRKLTEDETIGLGVECAGIVAGVENLNKRVMDALPGLKVISRVGVGMDSVDLEYAKQKGIIVNNTPDGPTRPVAELTVALAFDLLRRVSRADRNIRAGKWKKEIGNLWLNKKIGIIGLGRIGKTVASIFTALGNPVYAFDLYPDAKWAEENSVQLLSMEELLQTCDIISLHLPGNKDKTPVISAKELSLMRREVFLINVSRGGVVDEEALYTSLKVNNIAGAAIDVFINEPYSGKFLELDNVILTPHLGSYAEEAKLQMEIDAVKNVIHSLISAK
jgi:D-3-phosphoglycerate dehydrogenase